MEQDGKSHAADEIRSLAERQRMDSEAEYRIQFYRNQVDLAKRRAADARGQSPEPASDLPEKVA